MAAVAEQQTAYTVRLQGSDSPFACRPGETALEAMERACGLGRAMIGAKRIPVGCRRGGCGVCRVQVLAGSYRLLPQSRCHVSEQEEGDGYALACRLVPDGDLDLRPALKPRSPANRQSDRSNDTDRSNDKEPGGTSDGH